MAVEFTLKLQDNALRIYCNGVPHVALRRSELIGFQAWKLGTDCIKYCIEFYTKTGDICCEYDTEEKWKTILKLLDDAEMFVDFDDNGYR
jgi:hypothetical protein